MISPEQLDLFPGLAPPGTPSRSTTLDTSPATDEHPVPAPVDELLALDARLAAAGPPAPHPEARHPPEPPRRFLTGAILAGPVVAPLTAARSLSADPIARSRLLLEEMDLAPRERAIGRTLAELVCPDDRTWLEVMVEASGIEGAFPEDVLTRVRIRSVVAARQRTWAMIRERTTASYPEIGRIWGYDHATVMHGVCAHRDRHPALAPSGTRQVREQYVERDPEDIVDELAVRTG